MPAVIAAGAGFLVAVLWFDLMFDVQVLAFRGGEVPEAVLASIAAYYRRVTTTARPMNRLVAAAMLATLAGIVVEIAAGEYASWVGWVSLVLALAPIAVAGARTVPSAVRLGARGEDPGEQRRLANAICRQHICCFGAILALLVVQLAGT